MRKPCRILEFTCIALVVALVSCHRPPKPAPQPAATAQLGRLMFDAPVAFGDPGTISIPRVVQAPGGDTHLIFVDGDGSSQKVMYTRVEQGEFKPPSSLSQDLGIKQGGAFITPRSESDFVAYWVNVPVTPGQLLYKESENGGQTFSMEKQWNNRDEVRWPCAVELGTDFIGYWFVITSTGSELVSNRNFSDQNEPTIDTAQGIPFRLQAVTDGLKKVRLAYFERQEKSNGGRIAWLASDDGGTTFTRQYLFNDRVISSQLNFFTIAETVNGKDTIIHLLFSERSQDQVTLYYSRSVNDSEFTQPISVISSTERITNSPLLAATGPYVLIVTADVDKEGPAVRYLFSEDGGGSFDPASIVTRGVSNPETITGTIDSGGNVLLVWVDLAKQVGSSDQLYRVKGTLRGK